MESVRLSLPLKLALFSLLLLAVPIISLRLAATMYENLLLEREQSFSLIGQSVVAILDNQPQLFEPETIRAWPRVPVIDTYPLSKPILTDGRLEDWGELLQFATAFGSQNIVEAADPYDSHSLAVKFLSGRFDNDLFLLFQVTDDAVVYRQPSSRKSEAGDHVRIGLQNEGGLLDLFTISPEQAGVVSASLLLGGPEGLRATAKETRIRGTWLENDRGYILELQVPLDLLTDRLSLAVVDVDDPAKGPSMIIGSGRYGSLETLSLLPAKNDPLERILAPLLPTASKIWLVDRNRHLRALAGSFDTPGSPPRSADNPTRVSRLLETFSSFMRKDSGEEPFNLDSLQKALTSASTTFHRGAGQQGEEMISVTRPFTVKGSIDGVIVIQQRLDDLVSLRDRVVGQILLFSTAIWLIGLCALFFFGLRLAGGIRKMSSQTDLAVGRDGRILRSFTPSDAHDELGAFSRHLAAIISRLREYHNYQEKMADNLEHEMRTPLAGVSASLANLGRCLAGENTAAVEYLNDARLNMKRLEDILTRIREAAAIKEALQGDEQEKIDLCAALSAWVETCYRKTFPTIVFSLSVPAASVFILADPNRIFQMMDKLVENAADFSPEGATVDLRLAVEEEHAVIRVSNEGPELDEELADQLFHSMVSLRQSRDAEKIHMGLGLFIVRSIAEFHGGRVQAANRKDGVRGAVFSVRLPLHNWAENITIRQ